MLFMLLTSSLSAHAWEPTGWTWAEADLPVTLNVVGSEDTMPEGSEMAELQRAVDAWQDGWCWSPLLALDTAESGELDTTDGVPTVLFDDPDQLISAGAFTVTYTKASSDVAPVGTERTFFYASDSDIVFNDNLLFHTDAAIEAGECEAGQSMRLRFATALGFLLGLDLSCPEGTPDCTEDQLDAIMGQIPSVCALEPRGPNADDLAGLEFLYGTVPRAVCAPEGGELTTDDLVVQAGDTVECTHLNPRHPEIITGGSWDPGDGSDAIDGVLMSHTFDEPGTYTISSCITADSPGCGDVERCDEAAHLVTVCATAAPAFEAQVDGYTVDLVNQTDDSVAACIESFRWVVTNADGAQVLDETAEWSPTLTVGAPGVYDVVLTVNGVETSGTFEVVDDGSDTDTGGDDDDGGCGCSSAGGVSWLGLVALVAVRRRQ